MEPKAQELNVDGGELHYDVDFFLYEDGSVEVTQFDEDVWMSKDQFERLLAFYEANK